MSSSSKQEHTVPLPVTPYPELLPLDDPNLPWERFEALCEELISRIPGVIETHRYGRRGSRQKGIDIFADFESGERWAFQCRQWKKFTKTDATKAIQKTSYEANRFILMLSRQATSGVRDACDDHPGWDVWDVGDVSRKIREMDLHPAARLVETNFGPEWRKAFLGLQGLTPFVNSVEFFQPIMKKSALFNHTWQLVGRSTQASMIHEFIDSPQQNVAVLFGRGGIGKSKILHAFAESFDSEHKDMSLWFMAEGVPLSQNGADHLPYQHCVVVVDDAHRRDDLPALLALSRQRPHTIKLILSCRPQGINYLKSQLTQGGFDIQEVVDLPEVKELSLGEVAELARQALGKEFKDFAGQLASATWDCPLVTVVGGQLLAKKAIAPELLERDEEFRQTVLTRFRDILIGEVGDEIDKELYRSLLNLIAAVQPLRLDNEHLLNSQAEFLDIDRPRLLISLDALEEAGVLLRRGRTLRIVPDVLADHILHKVSVTLQGQPTGFADDIFNRFASLCPSEVLRNLSELDWRIRQSGDQASNLLEGVWRNIEQQFRDASNSERCTMLEILVKVAAYQPEKTLELVEFAIRNPATKSEDPEWSKVYVFTHNDVLKKLPALLHRISYTLDFLPRCCKLLWELGRDDVRALNSNPDHAIRILQDMACYDPKKPLIVNRMVLKVFEELIGDRDSHGHAHSPLDIIDPMLAKTGFSTYSEGNSLIYRSFILNRDSIQSLRQRCESLVIRCLNWNNIRISSRSIESLENALREPVGGFGQVVSEADRDQWRCEQLEILDHIANFVSDSVEPIVLLRIREILRWHRKHSQSEGVRIKANAIVSSIPGSFVLRLTRALMDPYRRDEILSSSDLEDYNYSAHERKTEQIHRALAEEFVGRAKNAREAYKVLTGRIQTLLESRVQHNPQVFLDALSKSDPYVAAGICCNIIRCPREALAPYVGALLSNVREWRSEKAMEISRSILNSNDVVLCRGLALSYRSSGWADKETYSHDVEIIKELLEHQDIEVKRLAIGSLGAYAKVHPREAIYLILGVQVEGNYTLAIEICQLFGFWWQVPLDELTTGELGSLLSKLEDVESIEHSDINAFLVKASAIDARAVVSLLLNRIKRAATKETKYSALPVLNFQQPLDGLVSSRDIVDILRDIRNAALEPGWNIKWWVPKLFLEVSSGFESAASLEVLQEWINSGDPNKIRHAAQLVSGANPGFLFDKLEFTSNLLVRASEAGHKCYLTVCGTLSGIAISGSYSRAPGQPSPRHVALKERALKVADQYDHGTPANSFFSSLAKDAESFINREMLRDEEEEYE